MCLRGTGTGRGVREGRDIEGRANDAGARSPRLPRSHRIRDRLLRCTCRTPIPFWYPGAFIISAIETHVVDKVEGDEQRPDSHDRAVPFERETTDDPEDKAHEEHSADVERSTAEEGEHWYQRGPCTSAKRKRIKNGMEGGG